jgi:hypothetical protein
MARIDHYEFGRIMIDGRQETRDLIILPDRVVRNWWRQDGHALVLDDLAEVLEELPSHRPAPQPPSTSPADTDGEDPTRWSPRPALAGTCRSRSAASGASTRSGRGGRLGGLGGLVELLDAGGQLEVTVGQATLGVAGQGQGDRVPADVDDDLVDDCLSSPPSGRTTDRLAAGLAAGRRPSDTIEGYRTLASACHATIEEHIPVAV